MVEITGTIKSVKMETRKPFRPSRYGGEQLEYYLDIALETDTDTVYFKTPAAMRNVATGGPFAIVTYRVSGRAATWMHEVGENAVATAGKPNDNRLEMLVNEGDEITVIGRLKADKVSRKGNKYRVLTHAERKQCDNS